MNMNVSNNILFLYSEIVGYNIPIFRILTENHQYKIHIIHWDKKKLKPYTPPHIEGVQYYRRSDFNSKSLINLCTTISPDIIYVSGWMDKDYLSACRFFVKKNIPVVCGLDDQWHGTLRQHLGSLLLKLIGRKYFSHAWVAGTYQYEYAIKMGFKKKNIIFNLLSCDTNLFRQALDIKNNKENKNSTKSFLYVGNFNSIKGTDILIDAFKNYREKLGGTWHLICVGNGEYSSLLENNKNVELINFSSQQALLEICKRSDAFILPSRHEQWGVVVHEFCTAGLPMILSENIGSRPTFFIENFNGFTFRGNNPLELAKIMKKIEQLPEDQLILMGKNSHLLSQRITSEISASSFLSILQ